MRRTLALLAVVGGLSALAVPAHASDQIYITHDNGCYTLWIEAKSFPLFCYNPPPI
jgi:hypothetical protein